jgi:hypothetical protein
MNKKSNSFSLFSFLLILLVILTVKAYSQESNYTQRAKSLFVELGGSGVSLFSANLDIRFNKGRNDGFGIRVGVGGESSKTEPIFGYGETKTNLFTVPLEVNYILGNKRLSFEIGYSLTYISETKKSSFRLTNPYYTYDNESGDLIVSYLPVGLRLKPKKKGFMLKFNLGPLWDYSAPNIFYPEKIQFYGGLAMGYSFY